MSHWSSSPWGLCVDPPVWGRSDWEGISRETPIGDSGVVPPEGTVGTGDYDREESYTLGGDTGLRPRRNNPTTPPLVFLGGRTRSWGLSTYTRVKCKKDPWGRPPGSETLGVRPRDHPLPDSGPECRHPTTLTSFRHAPPTNLSRPEGPSGGTDRVEDGRGHPRRPPNVRTEQRPGKLLCSSSTGYTSSGPRRGRTRRTGVGQEGRTTLEGSPSVSRPPSPTGTPWS